MSKYKPLVNEDKTVYTDIKRETKTEDEKWKNINKVGYLLGDEEDISRRKTLATAAMDKLHTVWIRVSKPANTIETI